MATTNTTDMLFSIPPPAQKDDTHKTYAVSIAIIVLSFFTCIFVAIRLTHRFRTKTVGLDDYAMILALIFYIGWTFLAVYLILGAGIGKPLTEITLDEYAFWFKGLLACTWMYPWSSACIRLSIIFFYRRIFFKGSGRILKWGLWTMLGLQAVYVIVFSILPAFTCQPFHYAWVLLERNAHCNLLYWYQNLEGLYAASLALDGLLLLFPMIPIAKLQMPLKKRLGVGFVFALGFSASVACAYKLAIWVIEWSLTLPPGIPNWFDYEVAAFIPPQFEQQGVTFFIPSHVEHSLALVGASLPPLWKLIQSGSERIFSRLTAAPSSGGKSTGHTGEPRPYNASSFDSGAKFFPLRELGEKPGPQGIPGGNTQYRDLGAKQSSKVDATYQDG